MPASIINGRRIADEIRRGIKLQAEELKRSRSITPGLAFILVGDNPASQSYVRMKGKACDEMGFYSITEKLPADTSESNIIRLIDQYNRDAKIHGVLVQLPLPPQIDEAKVLMAVDYRKDVDGLHPINIGRLVSGQKCFKPCTPWGIQELLLRSGHDPGGKHVVVVGRSNIVGKPIANMLLQKQTGANAIVTIAHTGAGDLRRFTLMADILIVAIGRPETVRSDMVKPGCIVIDVGTNRVADLAAKNGYRVVGDVHFPSVVEVARAISPVPGGVGPMTIAMLLQNTLYAARGEIYSSSAE